MKKMLMMLGVCVVLVGCGNADTADTEHKQQDESHTHSYTEEITTEATCEADGEKIFTCECGDSYAEVITATGHIYENYVSNNDATYLADGTETGTCVCGLTDTRTADGSKLEYTYTDLDKIMYAKQSVNVRDLPTSDGNKLGSLSYAQEVKVTGQCNETSWYRITFGDGVAYVSNSYLQDSKPEQQTTTQNTNTGASASTECPYELGVWYDMGWYFFKLCPGENQGYMLGENREYQDILKSRYPDLKVVSMAAESKWNGWVAYFWATPRQGDYVFQQ